MLTLCYRNFSRSSDLTRSTDTGTERLFTEESEKSVCGRPALKMQGVRGILKCLVPCIRHHSQNLAEGCEKKKKKICKRETCREVREKNEDLFKRIEDTERIVEEVRKHYKSQIAVERCRHCLELQKLDMELKNVRQEMTEKSPLSEEDNTREEPEEGNTREEPEEEHLLVENNRVRNVVVDGSRCKMVGIRGILKCLVPCIRHHSECPCDRRKWRTKILCGRKTCIEARHQNVELLCQLRDVRRRVQEVLKRYKSALAVERRRHYMEVQKLVMELENVRQEMTKKSPIPEEGNTREEPGEGIEGEECVKKWCSQYEAIKVLGRGAFGKVVLAKRKSAGGHGCNQEFVAIKVVAKEGDRDLVEKEVFMRAVGHPFLVQLLSFFHTKRSMYYVMEYLEGGDMDRLYRRCGPFPEEVACFYMAEITLAVEFLHKYGIVHRDIKLENILLDRDGHCKLADFGECKRGIFNGIKTRTATGTKGYMAPEIIQHSSYGPEVDWWSVGVVMFVLMKGYFPIDLDTFYYAVLHYPVRHPFGLSCNAKSIIQMFLTKDPAERLGANGDTAAIRGHPFFEMTDWEALLDRRVKPPFKQQIEIFATMDRGRKTEEDVSGIASFFETTDGGGMEDNRRELQEELVEVPLQRQTTQVCVAVIVLLLLFIVYCLPYLLFLR